MLMNDFSLFCNTAIGEKYLDALLKLDLATISESWSADTLDNFVWSHLIAAARYAKVDLIRILFTLLETRQSELDVDRLHGVLTTRESVRPPREEWEDMYGSEERFDDRATDENFNTFKKTALAWAVQNHDRYSVTEIVHYEKVCHPTDRYLGIRCLKRQLRGGDEILKWTIESFSNKYGYTVFQKWVKPFLCCVPMLISPFLFAFDLSADVQLSIAYYQKGFSQIIEAPTGFNATPQVINSTATTSASSDQYVPKAHHYQAAFAMNVVCILLPFLVIMWMCIRELASWSCTKKLPSFLATAIITIAAVPLTPFYFIYMVVTRVKSKFQHMGSEVKNEQRAELQKSEYLWGMARAAEAGLESSPQLILQLWLLSFHLCELSKEGVGSIGFYLDQAIDGALAFASAGRNEAGENQKNLAKILVSFITLSVTVSSSYKTLKRGSVRYGHLYFIYVSNFLQVLARCFSLFLYFTVVHDFVPAIVCPLAAHYLITLLIKLGLDPARHVRGSFRKLAQLVSIMSSSLVNVSIKPLKTDEDDKDETKQSEPHENGEGIPLQDKGQNGRNGDVAHVANGHVANVEAHEAESGVEIGNSEASSDSFVPQTAFFTVQFVENVCLCSFALGSGSANPVLFCMGGSKWAAILTTVVVVLSLFSWLGHWIYYGCWGHPWSDINGPSCFRNTGGCSRKQYRPCNVEEED